MSKTYSKTRILVECALMIAIGTVLSNIKFFTMPNGGSVTLLSMLPFVLVSFRHGVKWGLFTGLVNGCLQMLLGFWAPPTPTFLYFLGEILLDYLVAFTPLGLAGLFKGKKWGIFVGTVVGCLGRFVVHYISGVTIYKILAPTEFMKWTFTSPSAYSLVYNGSYMLPNTIIALVIAAVLYKPLKKYILGQDLGN